MLNINLLRKTLRISNLTSITITQELKIIQYSQILLPLHKKFKKLPMHFSTIILYDNLPILSDV